MIGRGSESLERQNVRKIRIKRERERRRKEGDNMKEKRIIVVRRKERQDPREGYRRSVRENVREIDR